MKAIITAVSLSYIALIIIGCYSAKQEKPISPSESKLESALNKPGPEIPVNVSTHVRFENLTNSPIGIKFDSTTEMVGPGSHVFIPEQYDNDGGMADITIVQQIEEEWRVVYRSRWPVSKNLIESYGVTDSVDGKIRTYGTRVPNETKKSRSAPERKPNERQLPPDSEPRRRVILEKK